MTLNAFFEIFDKTTVDADVVSLIEKEYGAVDDEDVRRLLCMRTDDCFIDCDDVVRLMTKDEIVFASSDLGVDFKGLLCIPFFDIGDNDFIVYRIDCKMWSRMNIVDMSFFCENVSLKKMLQELVGV